VTSRVPASSPRLPTRFRRRLRAVVLGAGCWVLGIAICATPARAQQAPEWPAERPPRPLPARDVKFPPYEVRTLPNGMQVVIVLHHEQPSVSLRLVVRAGVAQDPKGKSGLASLASSLLDQGTTTRSAEQIADQIDSIGGLMSTGSSLDYTQVTAVVMKDSFNLGMDLVGDVIRNPAFAPEEIDRQKQQALSSLQVSQNDPDYVASVLFDRLVYGFHPYGMPGSGTTESLGGITRQDLQAFHKQHFVPNNMILGIVGDVTSQEAFAAAERVFGAWPRGEVAAPPPIDPPAPTGRLVVVDMPGAVQTEVRVGQIAIPRKHPDYLKFDLAVKILGGEGANRLHGVLRSQRGLTYGASADTQANKHAGDLVAETDTRTETTGEVLRLTVDEFSRIQRLPVREDELAGAQAYLAGSFPLTIETPNQIATQVLNALFYELPMDEIATLRERVLAVTPADIQRVAQQYIRPDRLSIVLVGNAKAFVPQLRAVGFTNLEVIPATELDLMSATLRRDQQRVANDPVLPRQPTRAALAYMDEQANPAGTGQPRIDAEARDLLMRVVQAKGGLERLKGVRTVVAEATTVIDLPPPQRQSLTGPSTTYVSYPDKFRVDATAGTDSTTQIYNSGRGWVKSRAGVQVVAGGMLDSMAASVRRDIIPLLIAAAEGRYTLRLRPDEKGRAGQARKVLEVSGSGLDPVELHIDPDMLIAMQSFEQHMGGPKPIRVQEVFSDYRAVEGLQIAYEARVLHDDRPVVRRTLTKVSLNAPVDPALFDRPQ
jgi:predicted Zn-dependent peptidase